MGSDVHMYVEKKNKETGKWEILQGENKWRKRDRNEISAEPRDPKKAEWLQRAAERLAALDSGYLLRTVLKNNCISHLYKEGMEKGGFDLAYFRDNLTPEQFERLDFYDLEDAFLLEADFTDCHRNYDAFAILADVRNGRGFAGVSTGGGFNIISEPKGIPADASPYFLWKAEQWDYDGHSFSHFTVRELKEFDWNQVTMKTGLVGLLPSNFPFGKSYFEMKDAGEEIPESYFSGGSGTEITKSKADVLYKHLKGDYSSENIAKYLPGFKENDRYNVHLHWEKTYKEAFGSYYEELIENIPSMYPEATDDEIRYVFFFDN